LLWQKIGHTFLVHVIENVTFRFEITPSYDRIPFMSTLIKPFALIIAAFLLVGCGTSSSYSSSPQTQMSPVTAVLVTSLGEITLELYPEKAPKTVENFLTLSREGFYNGTKFHRVIRDFMIQGGDPNTKEGSVDTWGRGGPGYTFADEFNDIELRRGILAMANAGPNTNGSQFFIITADGTPWLQGKHTAFGRVIAGYDVVQAIESVETVQPGILDRPREPITISEVRVQ